MSPSIPLGCTRATVLGKDVLCKHARSTSEHGQVARRAPFAGMTWRSRPSTISHQKSRSTEGLMRRCRRALSRLH